MVLIAESHSWLPGFTQTSTKGSSRVTAPSVVPGTELTKQTPQKLKGKDK